MKRYIIPGILAALLTVSLLPAPTYTYVVRELSQTFSALQSFTSGLTVAGGTTTINGPLVDTHINTNSQTLTDLQGSQAARYNMTYSDYMTFLDGIYTGYLSGQYSSGSGWFTADVSGADGDGYVVAAPFSYINGAFLSYAGLKASQGTLDATIAARANSVIDKMFISPVWVAGSASTADFTRSLDCTGSAAAPTCTAGGQFSAASMAARADVFSLETYPGAYLLWLNYLNAGIGTTRRATLKTFIDDASSNVAASGYNQGDLGIVPVHLYLKHLAGTSMVSNFTTLVGSGSGWGLRFDTAASVLPYVTDAFAWNYAQSLAQTDTSNFQTLEYLGFISGAAAYTPMVAAGTTRNTTAENRLRAEGLRIIGSLSHNGWPAGNWPTKYGSERQDLPGYAIGYVLPALDMVMSNSLIFTEQERRWAKYLFDRALNTYSMMDTFNGDAADGVVNPEPFGAANSDQEQDGDKAVGAGHVIRAVAWHLILGNDRLEAEEPPDLAWYDWQQQTLVLSTPYYTTGLYADIQGAYSFGLNSSTYDTASGAENLGILTYVPTNERVLERPDEGQIATTTASSYGWRRLQHGMLVMTSTGAPQVLDEDSSLSWNVGQLRPLMKTDSFSVRGWGVSGSGYSRRPKVNFDPTWTDGGLIATSTIDRTNDTDAGNDDYKDVVTYRFHDRFIEESHDITAPGGACTTCFAYYLLRPPNNGQAYLTQAGRLYDSTATIGVRYEVQRFNATDYQPTTITSVGASAATNTSDGGGCPVAADGCTGPAAPAACCTAADVGATCDHDSAAGATTSNTMVGSVRLNTNVTYTLTHTIDADMGVTAAADNRISYQEIGRAYSGSPNHLVTLDGGTQRSKSAAGGDTNPLTCLSAGEVSSDYQATIYDSASDDAATVMTAGSHTLAVTNSSGTNIYLDAFQVTSQSPARFLDNETAGGWIPPANVPSGDNDWYLELRNAGATAGYIAWFPDKTLITKGIEARYVRKTTGSGKYNNDPPSVVAMKLYGDNYGMKVVTDGDTTVPAFQFSVEYYPYNGDHYEANRIWEDIIKWRPRVRAFSGASATLTISVNEIGIDVTPATKVNVYGIDTVGALGVKLDYANDDLIITRSDTGTSGAKIVWNVEKQ